MQALESYENEGKQIRVTKYLKTPRVKYSFAKTTNKNKKVAARGAELENKSLLFPIKDPKIG